MATCPSVTSKICLIVIGFVFWVISIFPFLCPSFRQEPVTDTAGFTALWFVGTLISLILYPQWSLKKHVWHSPASRKLVVWHNLPFEKWFEPAHEIMVLITYATCGGSKQACASAKSCQSFQFLPTWSMGIRRQIFGRFWRMRSRRTKCAIISWTGLFVFLKSTDLLNNKLVKISAGPGSSGQIYVWLVFRRSWVRSSSRATFFHGDWSWNLRPVFPYCWFKYGSYQLLVNRLDLSLYR